MRGTTRRCPIPVTSKLLREKLVRMRGTVPVSLLIRDRIIVAYGELPLSIEPTRNQRFIRFGRYARLMSGPITGSPSTNTHSLLVIGDTNEQLLAPISTTPRVDPCTAGDTSLVFSGSLTANKWYFLYDANKKETHRTETPTLTRGIGGELVYVTSVFGDEATIRHPLTQNYGGTGSDVVLVDVSDRVCENISIRGGTFIGKRQAGMRAQIDCGMVAGLIIQGCQFDTGWVAAVATYCCRDISIKQCAANKFSGYEVFGSGYTFLVDRSVNTVAEGLIIRDSRYGVSVTRGSAAWNVSGVLGDQCRDGAIDIHGGDCFNGTFQNIIAQGTTTDSGNTRRGTLRLGNSDWRRGASEVVLKNSYTHDVVLDSAIRDTTIENVTGVRAVVQGAAQDANTGAPLGKFDNVEFLNCTFTSSEVDIGIPFKCVAGPLPAPQYLWYENLKITGCTLTLSWSGYQPVLSSEAVSTESTCFVSESTLVNTSAVTTSSGKLMYLGAPKPAYLSGTGDPIEMTWLSTTALMPDRAPLYPVVGLGSMATGVSSVSFFDDTSGATPNRRGPTLGSLNDLTEDDFENISYGAI